MNTVTNEAYEGDIVSRLRNWRGLHLAHGGELFESAADEIERLRLELSVQKSCTVAGREEIARLREAVAPQRPLEERVAAIERWKDGFYDV